MLMIIPMSKFLPEKLFLRKRGKVVIKLWNTIPTEDGREHNLNVKDLIQQMKSPCAKCLYKQGMVRTIANPCPQCKKNGYQMYEKFQKQTSSTG